MYLRAVLTLLLIRHGETDENAQGILQGHAPTRLNAQGLDQARRLAAHLRAFRPQIELIVSSDLPRALETAQPLADALRVPLQPEAVWRERSFGPYEGRTLGEADIWRAANGHWDLPGAEPTAAFQDRVRAALEGLVSRASGHRCVAVVTHGAVLRNVLNLLADGRLPLVAAEVSPRSVPILNCSIMHLEAHRPDPVVAATDSDVARWRVRCVNDVDHLRQAPPMAYRVEE
jgi:probable phosphoglycerate mutase